MTSEATVIKFKGGDAFNPKYDGEYVSVPFYDYDLVDEYLRLLKKNGWNQSVIIEFDSKFPDNARKCNFIQIMFIIHLKTTYSKSSLDGIGNEMAKELAKEHEIYYENVEKSFSIQRTKDNPGCNPAWREFNFEEKKEGEHTSIVDAKPKLKEIKTRQMLTISSIDDDLFKFAPEWCVKFYNNKVLLDNEFIAGYQVLGCTFPGVTMNQVVADRGVEFCIKAIDISEPIVKITVDTLIKFNMGGIVGDFDDLYLDERDNAAIKAETEEIEKLEARIKELGASIAARKDRMAKRAEIRERLAQAVVTKKKKRDAVEEEKLIPELNKN